jgi:hypothetical protein
MTSAPSCDAVETQYHLIRSEFLKRLMGPEL